MSELGSEIRNSGKSFGFGQPADGLASAASGVAASDRVAAGFNPGIHGARGLFAFLVVVFHVANSGLPVWSMPQLVVDGFQSLKFGVELFFAISGFVIAGTMKRARTPTHFLLNRATRIFPVLWVVLAVILPLALLRGGDRVVGYEPLEFFFVVLGNMVALGPLLFVPVLFGPAWTLGYEFLFYELCFVYLVIKKRWKVDPLLPILAVGLAIIAFNPRGLYFLSGVIVAAGLLDNTVVDRLARAPMLFLLAFLAFWQAASNDTSPFFDTVFDWVGTVRLPLGILAFISATIAIQGIARGYGLLSRALTTRSMLWLGTISFSLYMWHLPIVGGLKAVMYKLGLDEVAGPWSQILLLLLALPPALMVAQLSQWLLEKKLTRYLRRWVD